MNTFEVSVEMKIQQIVNQDGSRCFWMQDYTNEQIKDKLLAEAEHRPIGVSLGDFIYRRCRVYYDTMVDDVPAELESCALIVLNASLVWQLSSIFFVRMSLSDD